MDTRFPDHAEVGRAVPSAPRAPEAVEQSWLLSTIHAFNGSLGTASPTLGSRLLLSVILLLSFTSFAQVNNPAPAPTPLPRAEGEELARKLIANLLAQKPSQNSSNTAVVEMRSPGHKRSQVPARFEILVTATNYANRYEAPVPGSGRWMSLTIVHSDNKPNEYLLSQPAEGVTPPTPKVLSSSQLNLPFGGSDFWAEDLGLEFLHWPQQRVLRKEMRRETFCAVLESVNPHPAKGDYSRVVSWIGINHPDEIVLVHADGYDAQDKLLKEFAPKGLKKVNGAWQLESMEMSNAQTESRTVIRFDLGGQ